jgi:hypothetical protein
MAKADPQIAAHLEWIGFIRPTGLVVSATALVRAGAILDRRDIEGQRLLEYCVEQRKFSPGREPAPYLPDFQKFAESVLGWTFSPTGYAGTGRSAIPDELEINLPEYGETLRPDFAVRELSPQNGESPWQLLVQVHVPDQSMDDSLRGSGGYEASPHSQMERLLRKTRVPAGLLFNGRTLRLISAPYGESSGWMDFQVAEMMRTDGRPICAALRLLLSEQTLLTQPKSQRLAALLADSRKYQNEVSERLAEQVLHALYEFLRGFQAAHDASKGELLHDPLVNHPDEVYRALLTVILRVVFVLYSEERDMLPEDETFLGHYSLAGLYERLREDAALNPDTMDQRFGAWAQLIVLFRLIHDGARSGAMRLPERHGALFDPDRFPFLEGRPPAGLRQRGERLDVPLVPDGTIYRALEKLLILDGERISYRALDVEQIGSVYETMMGFRLETASGRSVAIKAQKKHGAPTTIDLEELLKQSPDKRDKWIADRTDRRLSDSVKKTARDAATLEDIHAALAPIVDIAATPDLVATGAMILQPSEERRRSGSHYTPRELTEPIVRTTLDPILQRLRDADGRVPTPDQILDLKVCDPAMGSGAFLVEACRYLGDALIEGWKVHAGRPDIPADEDEVVFARRLVAQRCLYGVDRNPVAVDLAKVSLWLVTLARDHPLTFLDHALRHGDSLVGLSRRQIEAFHWEIDKPKSAVVRFIGSLDKVAELRKQIRLADEGVSDRELRDLWDQVQTELRQVRLMGDLVVAAFFEGDKAKEKEKQRKEYEHLVLTGKAGAYQARLDEWRSEERPMAPFHWEIEFLEVFERANPGFDAIVGNPPFAGKNTLAAGNIEGYPDWLQEIHDESHGNADLIAHFYRRAFDLLRAAGTFGLIATNTIAQGDTRATGLRWICTHSGEIYSARSRVKWPGLAAVVVSVLHVMNGAFTGAKRLDERVVDTITAFLFHRGGHDDPAHLTANAGKSFVGSYVLGMGFTFDDTDTKGVATPLAEMHRLIGKNPRNGDVIFPYIGGEEVNTSPTHAHHRYVINFGDRSESECRRCWPDLMAIIETKVKPERLKNNRAGYRRYWWQYAEKRGELYSAIAGLERVLAISQTTQNLGFAFLPVDIVYSHKVIVFPLSSNAALCALQARPHETWARFFGSTLEDRSVYTPSDCFETYPFPKNWESSATLEAAGKTYYDFRASLTVHKNEGLTKSYNRFHDPDEREPEIIKLRELHAAMDRAVLDAYGWSDIPTECDFLLDYEIDEEDYAHRKRPYRYRWPDDIRDEVLARLLELNATRAAAETRAATPTSKAHRNAATPVKQKELF